MEGVATSRAEVPTFCRVCEAECGVIATVEGGRITNIKADRDNPHSRGFMCTKAKAMVEITYDPDRVTQPMRRVGAPGEFEPVSWDEALGDIAARLTAIVAAHGPKSFAASVGNPTGFDVSGSMAASGLAAAIGSPWYYGVSGKDNGAATVAAFLNFGSAGVLVRPDIWRTHFLLVLGANPWISKGSIISEPRIRDAMNGVVERGGRVVVVDPRRTETARVFEHVAVQPGADAWLLLGILRVIIDSDLVDHDFLRAHTSGFEQLKALVAEVDVERCSASCGVPVDTIGDIARGFASAPAAAAYGRTGTCTQRFGTLNNLLINALNAVTGNIDRPGGAMFGWGAINLPKLAKQGGIDGYSDSFKTRVQGLRGSYGLLPTQGLWRDITEPGDGQIKALMTYSSNPVISSGAGGDRLKHALETLDLHFSLDLYMNETNKHADYILPGTTFYERPDIPLLGMALDIRPTLYATDRVVEPREQCRDEWRVLNEIAHRMNLGGAYALRPLRWLAKLGINVPPIATYDLAIRTSPVGDWFGLKRRGWSLKKLRARAPHGVELAAHLPVQNPKKIIATKDKRIALTPAELEPEVRRLIAHADNDSFPLRVIGLRELHSHNSWMHNPPRMTKDGREPRALVNPHDARRAGLSADGELLEIESATGTIVMPVTLTDDMRPGAIAVPHGWGHSGGWRRANAVGGVNSNELASSEDADIEPLAGMSILNGIPVRIRAVSAN